MMIKKIINILLVIIPFSLQAQTSFVPSNLGPEVNSSHPETYPVISPDGKTLYFVRANHQDNSYGENDSQDIWVSQLLEDGSWSVAQHLSKPFNTARFNSVLAVSSDGNKIYINGIFDKNLKWKKKGISVIHQIGPLDYSKPSPVKIKGYSRINRGKFSQIYINDAENLMILSFSKRFGSEKNNLFVSFKKNSGKWKKPKKIKKPVSSKKSEYSPSLSKDGKKLFFTAKNSNNNSYDIFISERLDEKYRTWSKPVPVSDTINSLKWDSHYSLNGKGSWLYYSSDATGQGSSDIFRVKLFEENPFVRFQGTVINEATEKPITGEEQISLLINGTATDSISIDPVNGTFSVHLPLGQSYQIAAKAEKFISIPYNLDVSQEREYLQKKDFVVLKPLNYIVLKGRILVKDQAVTIGEKNHPVIFINGIPADSAVVDSVGNYSLKLEHGKVYKLQVKADNYNPGEAKVDLSEIKEYQEINKDLYVSKIPEAPKVKSALMTGKIINSKTMKALDPSVAVQILVNDSLYNSVEIKDSTYTLTLPLGFEYKISASAEMFYPSIETINLVKEKEVVKIFKDLYIAPLEVGASVKLENIFFQSGKAALMPKSFAELDRVVDLLNQYPKIKIEIAGHTDNVGSPAVNKKLSQDRATAVAKYIVGKGIKEERIIASGYGMEKPVADNKTAQGRQQNRRVEFTILEN